MQNEQHKQSLRYFTTAYLSSLKVTPFSYKLTSTDLVKILFRVELQRPPLGKKLIFTRRLVYSLKCPTWERGGAPKRGG